MNRRDFFNASASAAVLAMMEAHTLLASTPLRVTSEKKPLIKSLRLLTNLPISELKNFYGKTLGLPISVANDQNLSIQAGVSTINFTRTNSEVRPFYHFAFNIPENKIEKALTWQRSRTPIVHPNPDGTPDAVVNFAHWNSHSVFFLDPAGNLLEYIARHDLKNGAAGNFSVHDILYVSEIGFIVDDVDEAGSDLQTSLNLGSYRDAEQNFWPVGDEYGLLLMIKKGRVWSSNPNQTNKVDVFKTSVMVNGSASWKSGNYPYEVLNGE